MLEFKELKLRLPYYYSCFGLQIPGPNFQIADMGELVEIYSNTKTTESVLRVPVNVNNSYLIVKVSNGKDVVIEKVFIK